MSRHTRQDVVRAGCEAGLRAFFNTNDGGAVHYITEGAVTVQDLENESAEGLNQSVIGDATKWIKKHPQRYGLPATRTAAKKDGIWIGYVDHADAVQAKRIPISQIKDGMPNHFLLFGRMTHTSFRYVESDQVVYWWYFPIQDMQHSVENFLARRHLQVAAHREISDKDDYEQFTHHTGPVDDPGKTRTASSVEFRGWISPSGERIETNDGQEHDTHAGDLLEQFYPNWKADKNRKFYQQGCFFASDALLSRGWTRVVGDGIMEGQTPNTLHTITEHLQNIDPERAVHVDYCGRHFNQMTASEALERLNLVSAASQSFNLSKHAANSVEALAKRLVDLAWRTGMVDDDTKYSYYQVRLIIDNEQEIADLAWSIGGPNDEKVHDQVMRAVEDELRHREEKLYSKWGKRQQSEGDTTAHIRNAIRGKGWEAAKRAIVKMRPGFVSSMSKWAISDEVAEDAFTLVWSATHRPRFVDKHNLVQVSPYQTNGQRYLKRLSELCTTPPDQIPPDHWEKKMESGFFHELLGWRVDKMPAKIEVHRGVPRADTALRPGDYVTTDRDYARGYVRGGQGSVVSAMVAPDDLVIAKISDYNNPEFIYFPRAEYDKLPDDPQPLLAPPLSFRKFWETTNNQVKKQAQANVSNDLHAWAPKLNARIEHLDPNILTPTEHGSQKQRKLDELAKVMRSGWPQNMPPLFCSYGNDTYELQDGHHRWLTALDANLTNVPCLVVDVGPMNEMTQETGCDRLDVEEVATQALRNVKTAAAKPLIAYHGTTAAFGKIIQSDGWLKPRATTGQQGNWQSGPGGAFGGNQSNPSLVYVSLDRQVAHNIMLDICGRQHTDGAIVTVAFDWNAAVPDEDTILSRLQEEAQSNAPPVAETNGAQLWELYAKVLGTSVDEAYKLLTDSIEGETRYNNDNADANLAEDMKAVAAEVVKYPPLLAWVLNDSNTLASQKPLKVTKVNFVATGYRKASATRPHWFDDTLLDAEIGDHSVEDGQWLLKTEGWGEECVQDAAEANRMSKEVIDNWLSGYEMPAGNWQIVEQGHGPGTANCVYGVTWALFRQVTTTRLAQSGSNGGDCVGYVDSLNHVESVAVPNAFNTDHSMVQKSIPFNAERWRYYQKSGKTTWNNDSVNKEALDAVENYLHKTNRPFVGHHNMLFTPLQTTASSQTDEAIPPDEVGYQNDWGDHHGAVTTERNYWSYGKPGYSPSNPPMPLPKKLYHVTPYADKIVAEGFKTFTKTEEQTFGGHGYYTSLTSLPNAQRYAKGLQDFIRVARGEYTQQNIQQFMHRWQVKDEWLQMVDQEAASIKQYHPEIKTEAQQWQRGLEHAIGLAHIYSGNGFPLFWSSSDTIGKFKTMDPAQVKILEVATTPLQWHSGVNLRDEDRKGKIYTVNRSENEWRVHDPPSLKVTRVLDVDSTIAAAKTPLDNTTKITQIPLGNCVDDELIDELFGSVTDFAQLVEEFGNEFIHNDIKVTYDADKDIHWFWGRQESERNQRRH